MRDPNLGYMLIWVKIVYVQPSMTELVLYQGDKETPQKVMIEPTYAE